MPYVANHPGLLVPARCLQGGKGSAPSNKGGSSSRSKPLKGKRAGPATGTTNEELLRRLGETIQVGLLGVGWGPSTQGGVRGCGAGTFES